MQSISNISKSFSYLLTCAVVCMGFFIMSSLLASGCSQTVPAKAEGSSVKDGGNQEVDAGNGKEASKPIPSDLDLNMKPDDFECILNWKKVNRYYITNKLGYEKEAIAVAKSPTGGVFPVGTVIQLVPQEAMVKRKKGWNPKTKDWEFFFLGTKKTGTEIKARGKEDVKNGLGGNCFSCHDKADAKWDLICGQDHGCDPLPFSAEVIIQFQEADPRCAKK